MPSFASTFFGRVLPSLAVLAAAGVAGLFGLEMVRSRAESAVYRDRLAALTTDYAALTERYNAAVKRAAVTELVVEQGALSVAVRTDAGEIKRIATPYDPAKEVYVDFALIDGRVWIRRVFDAATPPVFATVIDPDLVEIDWEGPGASFGQAVYRSLGEGRWVVTVTGSGALALTRADDQTPVALAPPPLVRAFEEVEAEARREAERVGWRELLARVLGP